MTLQQAREFMVHTWFNYVVPNITDLNCGEECPYGAKDGCCDMCIIFNTWDEGAEVKYLLTDPMEIAWLRELMESQVETLEDCAWNDRKHHLAIEGNPEFLADIEHLEEEARKARNLADKLK